MQTRKVAWQRLQGVFLFRIVDVQTALTFEGNFQRYLFGLVRSQCLERVQRPHHVHHDVWTDAAAYVGPHTPLSKLCSRLPCKLSYLRSGPAFDDNDVEFIGFKQVVITTNFHQCIGQAVGRLLIVRQRPACLSQVLQCLIDVTLAQQHGSKVSLPIAIDRVELDGFSGCFNG